MSPCIDFSCSRIRAIAVAAAIVQTWAALPWLSVARVTGADPSSNATTAWRIVDDSGREVVLRGANVEQEERSLAPPAGAQRSYDIRDYMNGSCPTNLGGYQEPPICEVGAGQGKFTQDTSDGGRNDWAQLRAAGFNFARLCISWSLLEEEPGVYNSAYLDRLEQIVSWAGEQDVYILLDMHQDLYSRSIISNASQAIPPYLTPSDGQDGAPAWATITDGWPALSVEGVGNLNLAVLAAFDNFWINRVVNVSQGDAPGPGLQDHYIGAIAALARRFVNTSTVVGFEIINEPQPGFGQIDPIGFGKTLSGFYARVAQAITGTRDGLPTCSATGIAPPLPGVNITCAYPDLGIHDTRHILFSEPTAIRNELDFAPEESAPYTSYPNVVYSPHVYTGSFTLWTPPSFDFAYETATMEANQRHAALVITEFGGSFDGALTVISPTLDGQERHLLSGSSIWSWKSNCVGSCPWSWTVFDCASGNDGGTLTPIPDQNGPLRPLMERLLSRPHPRGLLGSRTSSSYNATTKAFRATIAYNGPAVRIPAEMATTAFIVDTLDDPVVIASKLSANGTLGELYIPRGVHGVVTVSGAANLSSVATWPDGSRTAYIAPNGRGTSYTITISASTTALTSSNMIPSLRGYSYDDETRESPSSTDWRVRAAAVLRTRISMSIGSSDVSDPRTILAARVAFMRESIANAVAVLQRA